MSIPLGILAICAQPKSSQSNGAKEELRKRVDNSRVLNMVLEFEEVNYSENPPNQDEQTVVVTERRSKFCSDKRAHPDGTDRGSTSKKRKKKHKSAEPPVQQGRGKHHPPNFDAYGEFDYFNDKISFNFVLHSFFDFQVTYVFLLMRMWSSFWSVIGKDWSRRNLPNMYMITVTTVVLAHHLTRQGFGL